MAKAKPVEIDLKEALFRIKKAAIGFPAKALSPNEYENIEQLDERIQKILNLFKVPKKTDNMIYFVMYDIEDNKVRTQIAKYLERKGCIRVQKSIFIADSERTTFNEIHQTLKEVNEIYDNHDSIMLVPVSSDEIRAMKIIGQDIDLSLVSRNQSTLIF